LLLCTHPARKPASTKALCCPPAAPLLPIGGKAGLRARLGANELLCDSLLRVSKVMLCHGEQQDEDTALLQCLRDRRTAARNRLGITLPSSSSVHLEGPRTEPSKTA
jgi:hypothetical protein